jgi:hypothetical protein
VKRLTDALWRVLHYWISARVSKDMADPDSTRPAHATTSEVFSRPGKKFLHVGCGAERKPKVSKGFLSDDWTEITLDIDPTAATDVVASMLDMTPVPPASVEAVYSAHNLEHLHSHEVPLALREFLRVLKPEGLLVLICPDLQSFCSLVAEGKLTDVAYMSHSGPITPLDAIYGHREYIAAGKHFMAHHTGFTLRTLVDCVRAAGFPSVAGRRFPRGFELWIVASKAYRTEQEMRDLADAHLLT